MSKIQLKDGFSIEELQEREEFTAMLAEEQGGSCQDKCSDNTVDLEIPKDL